MLVTISANWDKVTNLINYSKRSDVIVVNKSDNDIIVDLNNTGQGLLLHKKDSQGSSIIIPADLVKSSSLRSSIGSADVDILIQKSQVVLYKGEPLKYNGKYIPHGYI